MNHLTLRLVMSVVLATGLCTRPLMAADDAALEQRVNTLLAQLTPPEKLRLMGGGSTFGTAGIARLGIPALNLADGPNGLRSNNDEVATVFPSGAALAATFNPQLVQTVGAAIGAEARSLGVHVLLGPNVNIQRTPLSGRHFESYSEDPYLAGRIGVGFVRGVQAQGVGTSPKHFVGNEQELERLRINSLIDERTLHEIYLAPFETLVREAQPWTVMASYNKLNGVYMTENAALLRDVLKGQWGFDGVLLSDWGAVHAAAPAANGGTDLEMPGPPRHFAASLTDAVRNWQVEPVVVDEAARRMLRLIVRSGALDAAPHAPRPPGQGDAHSAAHADVARQAAAEAITLLRNEGGLLPLRPLSLRSVAVIGPNADVPLLQGGGSASVVPSLQTTPLQALRTALGATVQVTSAQGVDNDRVPPPADYRLLSADKARAQPGLQATYFEGDKLVGQPAYNAVETYFEKTMFALSLPQVAARWEGWLWPERDGDHQFRLAVRGKATLSIDGKVLIGEQAGTPLPAESDFQDAGKVASLTLRRGQPYRVRIDYISERSGFHQMHFGIRQPSPDFAAAVSAARAADVAVVFVGVSRTSESEGRDRSSLTLPGRQDDLVEAVLAANPRTIVVLNNGAPLDLPWADRVPAIVEAWLPGQQGANALAQVLLGDVDPSGRLPFTFPRRLADNPAHLYYSGGREATYGEGVFVGYRYYQQRQLAPLYPFGFGLSYTRFAYSNLQIPQRNARGQYELSVDVRNVGQRAGSEVVQLYVSDDATRAVVRPPQELKGFSKVQLAPGQQTTVRFVLSQRDLSYYDTVTHDWVLTPGTHGVAVGSSSADLPLRQSFEVSAVTQ